MKSLKILTFLLGTAVLAHASMIPGTSLTPALWLKDAANNFDGSTWTATVGPDAVPVGFQAGSDSVSFPDATYLAPIASSSSPTNGAYAGETLSGVLFQGARDDMLVAESVLADDSDALTIFVIYDILNPTGTQSEVRPVGFGSQAAARASAGGNTFNLAADGSLRYDNGNNTGGAMDNDLFFRTSVLSNGRVSDYGNGVITSINNTATGGSFTGEIRTGDFFLGDVRAGATRTGGSQTPVTTDENIFIAEVIVFDRALTSNEIDMVHDYVEAIPEPSTVALMVLGGLAVLGFVIRRRR